MSNARFDSRIKDLKQALLPLMQLVCKITRLETAFIPTSPVPV